MQNSNVRILIGTFRSLECRIAIKARVVVLARSREEFSCAALKLLLVRVEEDFSRFMSRLFLAWKF